MSHTLAPTAAVPARTPHRGGLRRRLVEALALGLLGYLVIAYVVMPLAWRAYSERHPALDDLPGVTTTGIGIPGDPINVALVGSKAQLIRMMLEARWHPADALSLKSCLEIAEATVLKRAYDDAPVSSLYLWGRKEDLAFEQPVGDSPRRRHHVRFWRSPGVDGEGRPLWAGSVTFDAGVGFSHTTGQVTHHIAADVDAERDRLFEQLRATSRLAAADAVDNFHRVRTGRNGGGDPWTTDGRLFVGILNPAAQP